MALPVPLQLIKSTVERCLRKCPTKSSIGKENQQMLELTPTTWYLSMLRPTIAKLQKRKTKILNEVKQKILKLPRINR
jgi:hypothetical protein